MKTAIYCRVSSEDQAERGTIETQIEFATKYCDLHQLDIVEWYKDDGVPGPIPLEQRPEGARLLEDAQSGKFDLLLVYRLDRLGRTARVILNAVYDLEQHGIKIRSMTEPFDTSDPSGRFLLTVLAGVADLDRSSTLDRLWHGANRAAREGKWLGGIIPYGYRVNEEKFLEVNEDPLPGFDMSEADVVRLIYRLTCEQKYSTPRIADQLNALVIPPSYTKDDRKHTKNKRKVNTAGIWRPGRIRNMIINSTYKGLHQYGKRTDKKRDVISRIVPAIVSIDTWELAQQVLQENKIEAFKNNKIDYLLRGLIKCGTCGLTYHGAYYGSSGRRNNYYVCGGKTSYRGPLNGKCKSKNVPQQWIEGLIWDDCVNFILNPGDTIKELAGTMEKEKLKVEELNTEKELLQKTSAEKELEKQSILDLYRRKIIDSIDVEKQLQKITQEKAVLDQRIKDIERQIEKEGDLKKEFDTAEELLLELKKKIRGNPSFETRREVVKSLVKEIKVVTHKDERGKPHAEVQAQYAFVKAVLRTDNRAENCFDLYFLERMFSIPLRYKTG